MCTLRYAVRNAERKVAVSPLGSIGKHVAQPTASFAPRVELPRPPSEPLRPEPRPKEASKEASAKPLPPNEVSASIGHL